MPEKHLPELSHVVTRDSAYTIPKLPKKFYLRMDKDCTELDVAEHLKGLVFHQVTGLNRDDMTVTVEKLRKQYRYSVFGWKKLKPDFIFTVKTL